MPRRKSTRNLKECCSLNIAENIDTYWCQQYLQNTDGHEKYLYLIGPFENLAGCMIEDLINTLRTKKILRCHHLKLLLNSTVRKLNIGGWKGDLKSITNMLTLRCQKLTHLDISGCANIPQMSYIQLVQSLPNVVSLNLQSTNCYDRVLCNIGKYCKNLRELDVSCTPISDFGITGLCMSMDDLEGVKNRTINITKLNILDTDVTTEGTACALKSFHNLIQFNCQNTFAALELLHRNYDPDQKYKMNHLNAEFFSGGEISTTCFQLASSLCPNVTSVRLVDVQINDENLLMCAGFEHITEFQLLCEHLSTAAFYSGISAFLQLKGHQLTLLDLGAIDVINLPMLGQLCPNLKSLSLYMIGGYDYIFGNNPNNTKDPFFYVEELSFVFLDKLDIHASCLKLLLIQAKHLHSLHLHNNQSLTDDLLEEILCLNPLEELTNVVLEHCSGITGNTMNELLLRNNCLTTLKCLHCNNVTLREFQHCQQFVVEQNLDVELMWL